MYCIVQSQQQTELNLDTAVFSVMTAINRKIEKISFSFPLLSRYHIWALTLYHELDASEQSVQLDLILCRKLLEIKSKELCVNSA